MKNILNKLKTELTSKTNQSGIKTSQRFFKDPINTYGMKSKDIVIISQKYFQLIKNLSKEEMCKLCEVLFKSDMYEEFMIAANWIQKRDKEFISKDIDLYENWINKYVNNWAKCDVFCNHSVGSLVERYPKLIKYPKKWAKSKNLWMRRASAVSLIIPAKNGLFLNDIFEICDILLEDREDMVQKGYGWLLKVTSQINLKMVFDYVMKNKGKMPRTSLRYAIEKMPKDLKEKAMKK
ncbi:MAG TPA: DNA alkylation repair protein [Patescibacteria group bacterium]|nr:DNA alkylation repair protein [bacterium]HRY56633.1 DNA alkylation repair protein [Patescibacteria group bacterium]